MGMSSNTPKAAPPKIFYAHYITKYNKIKRNIIIFYPHVIICFFSFSQSVHTLAVLAILKSSDTQLLELWACAQLRKGPPARPPAGNFLQIVSKILIFALCVQTNTSHSMKRTLFIFAWGGYPLSLKKQQKDKKTAQ